MAMFKLSGRPLMRCAAILLSSNGAAATSRMAGTARASVAARTLFGRSDQGRNRSQSKVLADASANVFELQVDNIKPEYLEQYVSTAEEVIPAIASRSDVPMELVGSWTTEIGTVADQAMHMWRYRGGYSTMDKAAKALKNDKTWQEYQKQQRQYVSSRSRQVLVAFDFWGLEALEAKGRKGMYELRSYTLKPGTLIEWGIHWRRGIQYRGRDEAVCGWFSQIGLMHAVHHLWAYKNYVDRHDTRQDAWSVPGWDECVLYTVPLIRQMEAKILIPTSFSPLQ